MAILRDSPVGATLDWQEPPLDEPALADARAAAVLAHSEFYVSAIEDASNQLSQSPGADAPLDNETYITDATYRALLAGMSAWLGAARYALDTGSPAFAVARPPGHHATRQQPMGFCIFNFGAAAALWLLEHDPRVNKVAILDWDVHLGNGLVDILQDEPRARYVSLHQVCAGAPWPCRTPCRTPGHTPWPTPRGVLLFCFLFPPLFCFVFFIFSFSFSFSFFLFYSFI